MKPTTSSQSLSSTNQRQRKRQTLVFPDVLRAALSKDSCVHVRQNQQGEEVDDQDGQHDNEEDEDSRISQVFFDFANADEVVYRIHRSPHGTSGGGSDTSSRNSRNKPEYDTLVFHQDMSACQNHTGGIIWETSYLLLEYLLETYRGSSSNDNTDRTSLGRTLELGAGVGFLGQCLAAELGGRCDDQLVVPNNDRNEVGSNSSNAIGAIIRRTSANSTTVVLTETAEVLVNLEVNLATNLSAIEKAASVAASDSTDNIRQRNMTSAHSIKPSKKRKKDVAVVASAIAGSGHEPDAKVPVIQACALDWTQHERDIEASNGMLERGAFDTILGTDVIFTPTLVTPLLQTAARLCHARTVWYLCVQVRCATSHALFIDTAPTFGFVVTDITSNALTLSRCAWGKALDCLLFRITRKATM